MLVYGHLGFASTGVSGSAWATVASRWTMTLLLVAIGWRVLRDALVPWHRDALRVAPLVRMLRLGCTIGLQQMLEFGVFAAIGLLVGFLGTPEMAAHEIAPNLASLTFMVPLGVGAAAAVRVGHEVGEGNRVAARERAGTALVCVASDSCSAPRSRCSRFPASSRPPTPTSRSSRPSPHR